MRKMLGDILRGLFCYATASLRSGACPSALCIRHYLMTCSFCGLSEREVTVFSVIFNDPLLGPEVYICDECVVECMKSVDDAEV